MTPKETAELMRRARQRDMLVERINQKIIKNIDIFKDPGLMRATNAFGLHCAEELRDLLHYIGEEAIDG